MKDLDIEMVTLILKRSMEIKSFVWSTSKKSWGFDLDFVKKCDIKPLILKRGRDIQKVGARKNKKCDGDLEKFGLDQEEEPLWSQKLKKKSKP